MRLRSRGVEVLRSIGRLAGSVLVLAVAAALTVVAILGGLSVFWEVEHRFSAIGGYDSGDTIPAFALGGAAALLVVGAPYLLGLRLVAMWELHQVRRHLGAPASPRVRRKGPRSLVEGELIWRAFGWAWAELTAGAAFVLLALVPVVLILDTAYGTLFHLLGGNYPEPQLTSLLFPAVDGYPVTLAVFTVVKLAFALVWLLFGTPYFVRLHAVTSWRLLTSRVTELQERVGELAETRAGAVDAHTAELRRIERDLHDGMQAQLVNVAMRLGMAERRLTDDPAAVGTLLEEARVGTEEAMGGLRDVLRTMYPPVLADRGLRGALLGLAGRCTTATTVDMPELDDVPAPVEAAAYFVVAEALTNVAKHSAASHADVTVRREPRSLLVEVTDNGLGGADEERGTGLVGMRRRVAALDGWLEVTSPVGGPTVVVAELPCGS